MAHRKAGGSAKNLRDSNPKYLGTKLADGQAAQIGSIIVRQRGTKIVAGKNVGVGKDHTLFALADGTVKFSTKRKTHFDGKVIVKKTVSVISATETKKLVAKKKVTKKTAETPKAKKEVKEKASPKKEAKKPAKKVVKKTTKKTKKEA